MGIIQKRSFHSTLYLFIGILIGFVTSGLLLPNYFTEEENGLLTLLNSYSLIYSQIAILGVHTVVIRFFPHFKNEATKHGGFLTVMSLVVFASFLFFVLYYYSTQFFFQRLFAKSPLFEKNFFYLLPLTFFAVYFYLFDAYSTALTKTVRGFVLKDVAQRLFILSAIFIYIIWHVQFDFFLLLYCLSLCLPTIIFFGILLGEKQFSLTITSGEYFRSNWKYMTKVAGYSLLLGVSWVGVSNLDAIMIERMLDIKQAGIYGRTMFFGVLVAIPYRAIHKISSGLLSTSFKENNISNVRDIYYKSTLNQLILGIFIFIGIWLNIHSIFHIIPSSYEAGKYVIFFIGLGNLFTMIGGVNTAVISYSPYYRWNTIFVGVLLFMVIVTNLIFIPEWGITGAAVATALSILLYNLMMFLLLLIKYKFQPFSWKHGVVVLISLLSYFGVFLIPELTNYFADILLRSILFTIVFSFLILITRISPDINSIVLFSLKRIRSIVRGK